MKQELECCECGFTMFLWSHYIEEILKTEDSVACPVCSCYTYKTGREVQE